MLGFLDEILEKYHSASYRPAFLFKKQHCFHKLIHTFFFITKALDLEAITDQDLLKFHDRELPSTAILDMKKIVGFLDSGGVLLHFPMLSQNRKLFDVFVSYF